MKLRFAVTGHRFSQLTKGAYTELEQCLANVFEAASTHVGPIQEPVVLSGLAEGADRLLAWYALHCGWELHAVLPFRPEDYARDFGSTASKNEFTALLEKAAVVHNLNGSREQSNPTAYEALGQNLVANCDVLIAVWDGQPARGPGGTAEVVTLARQAGRPVVWISSAAPYAIQVLMSVEK